MKRRMQNKQINSNENLYNWIKRSNFALVIELERHIEILLLSNDCVMVPGLGGFVAHHADAYHDDVENMFFPPLRTVGFNSKLSMNDSLLIHSYTEAYDLSYPEAENRIRQEVDRLKECLEEEGEYTLNNIGVLSLGENGAYDFTPCEAGILTPELYGLSSFEFAACNDKRDIPSITIDTVPVKAADMVIKEDAAVATDVVTTHENTISIKVSAIRNVAAFAIAVIAFFFISTPLGSDRQMGMQMGKIENGMIYRLMPKDVTLGNIDKLETVKTVPEAKVSDVAAEKKDTDTSGNGGKTEEILKKETPESYYCIVLASRITKKNAEDFAAKLRKNGLDDASVLMEKGNIKVVSGRYGKEKDAYAAMNRMKQDDSFHDVWVYRVRN